MISPVQTALAARAIFREIWASSNCEAKSSACANKQSPSSTVMALPQRALGVGWSRRVSAPSMMSSCTSVARWIISTMTARRVCSGVRPPVAPPASSAIAGRSRLPEEASA